MVRALSRSLARSAFALLVVFVAPTPAASQTITLPRATMHAIDSIFAPYSAVDAPGASLAVIKHGRVLLRRTYGLADLESGLLTNDRTNYRLASVTKQFTAMAILLLAKDGKLHLDDPAVRYLPDLPAADRAITIRQLLTHTSGMLAYEDFVPDSQRVQVHDRDVPGLIKRVDSTYFPPGSAYRYSNSGYVMLGLIVEAVSHESFAHFLHARIFAPLHMDSTVAYEAGVSTVPQRAYGYSEVGDDFHRTDQSPTSATLGDGGIYSSITDLIAWNHGLDAHLLIDAATQRLAWTPFVLTTGAATQYGFGWNTETSTRGLHLWHTGETRGFTNAIVKYPDESLTVIVLTNRTGGDPLALAEAVARMASFSGR